MLSLRSSLALTLSIGLAGPGCGGNEDEGPAPTLDAAAADLVKEEIGIISAFVPYVALPEAGDKYTPKRTELDRAIIFAANEVRFAALGARQKLQTKYGSPDAGLVGALDTVATSCADLTDLPGLEKCKASIAGLGPAIEKAEASVSGVELPRVGEGAITAQTKKRLEPFLRARGPSEVEKAFAAKRADASAAVADVSMACQAASGDIEAIATSLEKAEEALHLVAVTHQMSLDSQCNKITAAASLQNELRGCEKDPDTPECKIACSKARAIVDKGVPAAALESLDKDVTEICEDEED